MEMPLQSKQRAYLRSLAQEEAPVVFIGKAGITPAIRVQLEDAIQARELVKCRVLPNAPADPKEIAANLAEDSGAEQVSLVGRNFVLWRRSKEKPRIDLP
jgi:RNA-binding protein